MKATFGGGCFWCTEVIFLNTEGIISVLPGYMGGTKDKPTYEEVYTDTTGHVEVVHLEYDETKVSYEDLLVIIFQDT
ncbi:peptide-methionine (S)-S-oxide reductase [Sphingobacterium sp. T2]|uniref:peptide-methionine (S)-S-oxide reductase n=1 Tax=Sphingobacterium sp. T2 TaxID=1590596 RepID=UPI000ADD6AA9|nr:peptide-methionine (S)-S-oxide reductase [Sphingobacterium sp. T2]